MDYTGIKLFEEAFDLFLRKLKIKEEIVIEYYRLTKNNEHYDFAFFGYTEEKGGRHGIHYNRKLNFYYFGTRNIKLQQKPEPLTFRQESKIPKHLKQAFFEVANQKRDKKLKE
jgi:hypothetical protein